MARLRSLFERGVQVADEIFKRLSSHESAPMEVVFWSGKLHSAYLYRIRIYTELVALLDLYDMS